jgi:hypothetical protein
LFVCVMEHCLNAHVQSLQCGVETKHKHNVYDCKHRKKKQSGTIGSICSTHRGTELCVEEDI